MRPRAKTLLFFFIIAAGLSLIASWRFVFAAPNQTAANPGRLQIDGPIELLVTVDPPTAMPGNVLNLNVSARNTAALTQLPQISIQLPSQLQLQSNLMPAGTSRNFQTNTLTWQPVLSANGGAQQFSLPLRVETADITNPEKVITAVLTVEGGVKQASTTVWIGLPPQIDAINVPAQVSVGLPVPLRADTAGPGPITQSWQLGDGRQVNVNNPVVVYPAVGVYELTLRAANVVGQATASRQIIIVPHPTAQFSVDDASPGVGQTVTFINESGGQQPLRFTWDFGDGATAIDFQPTHIYQNPGVYDVRLIIENDYGRSEAVWPLAVGQPPLADMQIGDSVPMGQPLSGTAFGDGSVSRFLWDMGDGRTQEGAQISHTYLAEGDYYINMTAFNDFGATQIGRWVRVGPGALSLFLPLVVRAADEATTAGSSGIDPFAVVLEPVDLDGTFVMQPLELPPDTSQAEALLIYINEARRQFNLSPLKYVYELSAAAQGHTADMATYGFTAHTGSDGSFPAERLLWHRYQGAYAGEATAWGFEHAYQAVEFWVNSPGHRRIILNQWATDVGVAFTVDYKAPNVWYWTAEFGNRFDEVTSPLLRVQTPASGKEVLNTDLLTYSWNWPVPLAPGEQFAIYVADEAGQETEIGRISSAAQGTLYRFQSALIEATEATGLFEWLVRLENGRSPVMESEWRSLSAVWDPDLPTPTPIITPSVTPTGTLLPTAVVPATATPNYITITPRATSVPPPALATATPLPFPTQAP